MTKTNVGGLGKFFGYLEELLFAAFGNQVEQVLQPVGVVGGADKGCIGTMGDYDVFKADSGD